MRLHHWSHPCPCIQHHREERGSEQMKRLTIDRNIYSISLTALLATESMSSTAKLQARLNFREPLDADKVRFADCSTKKVPTLQVLRVLIQAHTCLMALCLCQCQYAFFAASLPSIWNARLSKLASLQGSLMCNNQIALHCAIQSS